MAKAGAIRLFARQADGQRNYSWDAENRLVGITYPGQAGKQTAFAYDGLSRRIAIGSTPAGGGSATTTSYLWCGSSICQARNAGNATIRAYYAEGEIVPGTTPQTYYYGQDQIGSTRRVFASTTSAPAYGYDPYGRALQATAPLTDFNYAGMFYNADSGLYLTWYRAYDANVGRWLSRDPIDEIAALANQTNSRPFIDATGEGIYSFGASPDSVLSTSRTNLYAYVSANPLSQIDPSGLGTPTSSGQGGGFSMVSRSTMRIFDIYGRAGVDIDNPGTHYPVEMHFWCWPGGSPTRGPAIPIRGGYGGASSPLSPRM